MSENFWKELPHFEDFDKSLDPLSYKTFDPDWYLFIADIQGSTKAIQAGKYKDVNLVGALCIVAVLNACKNIDIPFVFGGDGASITVPASCYERAKDALLSTKIRSQENFDLQLRVGAIRIGELQSAGITLEIAKYKVSKDYYQALFRGGGMAQADTMIKQDPQYCFDGPPMNTEADFTGLECRWKDVFSSKDETISLLVYAHEDKVYRETINYINMHLGRHEHRRPVETSSLRLSFSLSQLFHEARAKEQGFKRIRFLFTIFFVNILGWILMQFNIRTQSIEWGNYKHQITQTTDSEKFDDMLRMVCSVSTQKRKALEAYLQDAYEKKRLCYGIHVSNRALMTCLVFERMGSQVHFIDAADGGYAMAALELKEQLKTLALEKP